MAREPRHWEPGLVFHVFDHSAHGRDLFLDDTDRWTWNWLLGKTAVKHGWRLLADCLMSNHFHLMVEPGGPTLGAGMAVLKASYARRFNKRHRRWGIVFQGTYGAVPLREESHLLEVARYVVLNPVRAGLVRKPEEWSWSSYRATAGLAPRPRWLDTERLLRLLRLGEAGTTYADFVARGMTAPGPDWRAIRRAAARRPQEEGGRGP